MSGVLRQSTSTVLSFGPFVSPSDGVTLVTSLVSALDNAATGVMLSKNGGALAVRHAAVTATTYDAYGDYLVTLDATDTGTVGRLRVQFAAAASCLPVWRDFDVITQSAYDALFGSAAIGQTGDAFARIGVAGAGLTALGDTRIAHLDADVSSRSTFAGGAVASVTADVGITQAAADKVWGSAARSLTTFGTLVADVAAAVWGAATRVLTAGTNIALAKGTGVTGFNDLDAAGVRAAAGLASANLDTQLAAINSKTTNLPTAPADETLIIAATNALGAAIAALPDAATVSAIKAKTDSLTFTVPGKTDANVASVNGYAVTGNGRTGTEWGPA